MVAQVESPAMPGASRFLPHADHWSWWLLGAVLFAVLATANGAGYRYGASDQAFYIPAVTRALDPEAFPHDRMLLDAQGRLMLLDETLAAVIRATGWSLETLFYAGYLLSLAVIWAAVVIIGRHVHRSPWVTLALGAALTLRHRIPRTSVNSFEPYFSPRMLAYGLGLLAVAAILSRRRWWAVALVAVSAAVHITTALWFGVLIGVALLVLEPRLRRVTLPAAAAVGIILAWGVTAGPWRSSVITMDGPWLQALAVKDSLFATGWPAWAWMANVGLLIVLWWAHAVRRRRGEATREDTALVWGATALAALFFLTLPFVAAGVALPVQLQISRVFWLVDALATIYALALVRSVTIAGPGGLRLRPDIALALVLLVASTARGVYVMTVEHPERRLYPARHADSPWEDAMRWLSGQPIDTHALANPGHAWMYGTSVRVSAGRDVLLEEVKDSAVAIYSREVALRVVERTAAIGDFDRLTASRARELAERYDLDYLVTTAPLELPVSYRNQQFIIYALR